MRKEGLTGLRAVLCMWLCGLGAAGQPPEDMEEAPPAEQPVASIAHYDHLRITEIMYHPPDGSDFEFIELKNTGATPMVLSEMRFTQGVACTFPAGTTMGPGSFLVVAKNAKAFTLRYGRGPDAVYDGSLSDKGETITLSDCMGQVVESADYDDKLPWPESADGSGYSLVLDDPGGDPNNARCWSASNKAGGSPWADDGPHPHIVINEVLAHSDPPIEDAIELYNAGAAPVDIGGWYLSDDGSVLMKFPIMEGMVLEPGAYMCYYEVEFNADAKNPSCFAVNSHGDTVWLTAADRNGMPTGYKTAARFGASPRGVSFGRYVRSDGVVDFPALQQHTFGVDAPSTVADFRTGLGAANSAPRVGPVVIHEIMYNPAPGDGDEFIELHNITDAEVPLHDPHYPFNTWRLTNAVSYSFPPGTTLAPRGYLVVAGMEPTDFRAKRKIPDPIPVLGPYSGQLNNGRERITLMAPDEPEAEDGFVPYYAVDRVDYADSAPWPAMADGHGPSLERRAAGEYGNDPINWGTGTAGGTPGAPNGGALVPQRAAWRYFDKGAGVDGAWRTPAFRDGLWGLGNATFGYGDTNLVHTTVTSGGDEAHKFITTCFRTRFRLPCAPARIRKLTLIANCTDGYVAYLNGTELLRQGMPPGAIAYETKAVRKKGSALEELDLTAHAGQLAEGDNLLAVEVHRADPAGNLLLMDVALAYEQGEPEP
ncbi:MAG: lamin tail domain-containing protein [Kiritimatiellae bacterium]|nr:lamin tail domain-containing protein [Kiritimatiellia bacterium]